MPLAELYVTDGTTTVDLLSNGLCLVDWRPSYPAMKGGGTWQSSPFIDGRRLTQYSYEHIADVFTLNGHGYTQDAMIRSLQELSRLLIKGRQYWTTDWQDEPVYLVAKAGHETNTRYALIHSYNFPEDDAPYGQPFAKNWGRIGMEGLTLAIEHALWQSTIPGEGVCTEIFATKDYRGVTYGREHGVCPSNPGEVYVANKDVMANIDHIYWWDAGGWSGNLVGTMPYSLFRPAPNVIATGDYVIFGIETNTGAGLFTMPVFSSLVFDLIPAVYVGAASMTWYRSNNAPGAWVLLAPERDNTAAAANQPLSNPGVNSVHWEPHALWREQAEGPGPTTCLWIKLEATVGGGESISIPQQQTRNIYHIAWPHVEISSADVAGDIPAVIESILENEADDDGSDLDFWTSRVIVGLRSLGRGTDFTAYLNCGDEQNIAGVTVALGANSNWTTNRGLAAGRGVLWDPPGVIPVVVPELTLTITLDSTLAWQWYGAYRAFIRAAVVAIGTITGLQLRITTGSGGVFYTSLVQVTDDSLSLQTVDVGKIVLPASVLRNDELEDQVEFAILATQSTGAPVIFADLILIPVDEWAGDFIDAAHTSSSYTTEDREIRLDSLIYPKKVARALLAQISTNQLMSIWQTIVSDRIMLQSNRDQRLWFTFTRYVSDAIIRDGNVEIAHSVDISRTQRYLSMRGDR